MDIDHIPVYIIKFRNLDLIKAYHYFKNIDACKDIALFHTIEVLFALFVFSFYNKIALLIFLTFLLHITLDFFEARIQKKDLFH